MLSYQHAYHAGNHADLLKHLVLREVLAYLTKKPAPLTYVDSHAGEGAYDLTGPLAQRHREFEGAWALRSGPRQRRRRRCGPFSTTCKPWQETRVAAYGP